ncbi:hypothetical protein BSIN_5117 [Burkholderia singularis]|uniref:Uncharacterized protein n=1 Tax=Burkholderia singularis TaxID=1503053 RepID=A0A238HBW5_9BURK|nr:hypothetical protein BSIN_5117 [Burkholderia singularis]
MRSARAGVLVAHDRRVVGASCLPDGKRVAAWPGVVPAASKREG